MSTALAKLATNVGVETAEITDVVKTMIVSAKNQHGAKATNAELTVVAGICAQYGLNPLAKEAHAFISGGKLSVVIGIDGWIKIMNRQPTFNGVEFEDNFENGELVSVTTKIHIKGRDFPTCVTEYMDECYQSNSQAWKKFKKRMLRNKSLGQCIRVAFGISEVIDNDEADRIQANQPVQAKPFDSVNYEEIDSRMAECGDMDTLNGICVDIRKELEGKNLWNGAKAKCAAMKVVHKDRINSYAKESVIEEGEFEEISEQVAQAEQIAMEAEALAKQVRGESNVIDADLDDVPFE